MSGKGLFAGTKDGMALLRSQSLRGRKELRCSVNVPLKSREYVHDGRQ
jgi:hypothetical protein